MVNWSSLTLVFNISLTAASTQGLHVHVVVNSHLPFRGSLIPACLVSFRQVLCGEFSALDAEYRSH